MTKIEWTKNADGSAGKTWNPLAGCSHASPGCTNCYAQKMAARLERMLPSLTHYSGLTQPSKAGPVWTGKLALAPDHILLEPLKRKKPTTYFVNSMSDLFHEDVPDEWILRVLDIIRMASYDGGSNVGRIGRGEGEHTFQVLTKRSARMRDIISRLRWDGEKLYLRDRDDGRARVLLKNLWLGVSCEDQRRADERIPDLLGTPAAVRFVSAEPLLGPINFNSIDLPGGHDEVAPLGWKHLGRGENTDPRLDWIIVGGESGPAARAMHPDWARSIRDQCQAARVAFFFKQFGEHEPIIAAADMQDHMRHDGDDDDLRDARRKSQVVWPDGTRLTPEPLREWWANIDFSSEDGDESEMTGCAVVMRAVGKKVAGRLLDGREWNEMPKPAHLREQMA